MLSYYLQLALKQTRQTPLMSALTVFTLAIGFAVFAMMLLLVALSSRNPLPEKRNTVFAVHVDGTPDKGVWADLGGPGEIPSIMSYPVAKELLRSPIPRYQAALFGTSMALEPSDPAIAPFEIFARVTGGDFFPMFNVPFAFGARWSASADQNVEQVVVLSHDLNEKLFAGQNSVGKDVRLNNDLYRVVGVLSPWQPKPRFYALEGGPFSSDDLFLPYGLTPHLLRKLGPTGRVSSFVNSPSFVERMNSELTLWQSFWVELPSGDSRTAYQDWLNGFMQEKQQLGWFNNGVINQILTVDEWINLYGLVSDETRSLLWLAFAFYLLCLANTAGQLLARFFARHNEIGLRHALGASRVQMVIQLLIEALLLGVLAIAAGLLLARGGLIVMHHIFPNADAVLRFDWSVLAMEAMGLLLTLLLVSLYPIWLSTRQSLASQLKPI